MVEARSGFGMNAKRVRWWWVVVHVNDAGMKLGRSSIPLSTLSGSNDWNVLTYT